MSNVRGLVIGQMLLIGIVIGFVAGSLIQSAISWQWAITIIAAGLGVLLGLLSGVVIARRQMEFEQERR